MQYYEYKSLYDEIVNKIASAERDIDILDMEVDELEYQIEQLYDDIAEYKSELEELTERYENQNDDGDDEYSSVFLEQDGQQTLF